MCSGPHLLNKCQTVEDYIKARKCKRNAEGKVVLPSGAWIPQDPRKNMLERIDKWHSKNPNQMAATLLFHTVDTPGIISVEKIPNAPTFQLSTNDQIATLEAELFNLKSLKTAKNMPAARTRAQKAQITTIDEEAEEAKVTAARTTKPTEETRQESTTQPATQSISTLQPTVQEHPFHNTKDAANAPIASKQTSTISANQPTGQKKSKPAYRTFPPIYDANIMAEVYK